MLKPRCVFKLTRWAVLLGMLMSNVGIHAEPKSDPKKSDQEELKELELGPIEPKIEFATPATPVPSLADRTLYPFQPGESFKYEVRHKTALSSVLIGECLLETGDLKWVAGKWAIRFKLSAISADWYKWMFTIKDTVEGYFDLATNQTLYLTLSKREGSYRQEQKVQFDYFHQRILEQEEDKNGKPKYRQFQNSAGVIDAYSIVYLIRKADLNKVKDIRYRIYSNGVVYDYQSQVLGQYDIEIRGKKHRAHKVEILTKVEGALEQRGGIFVFFSTDNAKVPLRIAADVAVGRFTMDLKE